MGKEAIPIAVFMESNLDFIGVYSSLSEAASTVLEDQFLFHRIQAYIVGRISSLRGRIWIPIDSVDSYDLDKLKKQAELRKARGLLTRLYTEFVHNMTDKDVKNLMSIVAKYDVNKLVARSRSPLEKGYVSNREF